MSDRGEPVGPVGGERSSEPVLVVPLRRWFAVGTKVLVGAVVAFPVTTLAVSVLMFASIVPPPEGATPAQALVAGVFVLLLTLSVWWGSRRDLDLVATDRGLSVPGRKISLRWEELCRLDWDEEKGTLWAVRSDDRPWYRRKGIPLISYALYEFSTGDRERLRSL